MPVGISGQEQELKEQHTGCPNRRRTTEPRQDTFANQGLHLEEQKGGDEDDERMEV